MKEKAGVELDADTCRVLTSWPAKATLVPPTVYAPMVRPCRAPTRSAGRLRDGTFSGGIVGRSAVLGTVMEIETARPVTPQQAHPVPKTTTVDVAAHSCEVRMTPPSEDLECWFVEVV